MSLEQWLPNLFLAISFSSFLLLYVLSIKTRIGKYLVLIVLGIKDVRYLQSRDRGANRERALIISLLIMPLASLLLVYLAAFSNARFLSIILSATCMGFGFVILILDIYLGMHGVPEAWGDYK
jgi:hypothetical protein